MPTIKFENRTIECAVGDNLRQTLLKNDLTPHNGPSVYMNCRGNSGCGTCAVKVEGEVSPMGFREGTRLSLPPHKKGSGLRLSCQATVLGDVEVEKFQGMWGQKTGIPR